MTTKHCILCGHRRYGIPLEKDSRVCAVCILSLPAAELDSAVTKAVRELGGGRG